MQRRRPSAGDLRRGRRLRPGLALAVAALALAAAAAAAAAPAVEVLAGRVEVVRLGLSAADLVLRLVVANRTAAPLTLRELTYRVTVAGAPLRDGRFAGPLVLPPGAATEVALPASVGYGEAGGRLLALVARGEVRYRVVGSVRVEGPEGTAVERFDESGTVGVTGARPE